MRERGYVHGARPIFFIFLLLSLALNFRYLWGGFQNDDFMFLNLLRQDPVPHSRWTGFWSLPVSQYPSLTSLWWADGDMGGGFLRPIPSLVFEASIRVFGERASPLHLLSLLLHGLVGFVTYLLFARSGADRRVAFLAGALFVVCEDHSMGIGWIATITDMLCVAFLMLSLLAHLRWRRTRAAADLLLFLLPLTLAFGSKESAAIAPVLILLLEFWVVEDRNTAPGVAGHLRSFLRRWPVWSPALAAMLVYLGLYRAIGPEPMHNLMYLDPRVQPLAYLRHLVLHLPVMIVGAVTAIPPSVTMFEPRALPWMAALGAALLGLLLVGLWPSRREGLVRWSFAAFLLMLLPQMGTDASERLLYLPMVPASYFLASLAVTIRVPRSSPASPPILTRAWGWSIVVGLLGLGTLSSAVMPWLMVHSLQKPEKDILTSLEIVRERHPELLLILNTSGPFVTFYPQPLYEYHLERQQPTRVLSSLSGKMTLERVAERSIVLRTDRPGWLSNMFARIVRTEERLTPDRRYSNETFDATLLELSPDGRDVLAVRFDFHHSFDDPSILFLSWNGERFLPVDLGRLPREKSVVLADTSDPMTSM